ncbi:hypothetical protein COS50_02615 [Candidatus Roizmanbacteria bacterium CG03_land_8_20_14_0_80_35_26]|uniref:Serine aminopeptidase S33 domain-containing protein n=3 Tax=Candidatus Roizmaniibacteriota TaxID=1752723 RepID=A0A2M7BWP7_9BACT|nr:MAG: hypothetical protein COV86_02475 [Candidatus Roizmanbacteria bacterium CG11_big_fil_rev_8_21_14_0_20_35_14]PIV10955.1 MAG: hypothetical protein COS50_02615 [Candidatus Roizmanbacteria bacterium CG03_land_8_20_14_0_80_35_26]PJC32622.1 MAG: hypothetical protein CO049_02510 [Candidatus Roizmanbacteria bacterium CG_4_9_14_0_2_um_filter_36_12]
MKGELVRITTKDGLELVGFFIDKKSDIAVLHFHGTSGDFYTHKFVEVEGEKLAKENISFLTANNRGHDVYADIRKHKNGKVEWTQIGGGFEKFEDCLLDIDAWIDFLIKRGIKKIILQGHSLSQKILYYQYVKKNPNVIGQIHLSPQNDDGLMYYALGEKKYQEINKKIKQIIKEGRGNEVLPKEYSPVSYVTSAQMYHGYLTDYGAGTLTPYHNPQSKNWQVLEKTTDPLLVIFGSKDAYMKPSSETAAKLMKEKAKSAKSVMVKLIKGATHSYLCYEKELVEIIFDWIKNIF